VIEPLACGELTAQQGTVLTTVAVASVARRLVGMAEDGCPPADPRLRALGACFVTLESRGNLRGCIGSLAAVRPLYRDVVRNAHRAMTDPRLPPVAPPDWPALTVTVSVLSEPAPIPASRRDELIAELRPGIDGLIVGDAQNRATFLPVVWHKLGDPHQFLSELLAKGGWEPDGWPEGMWAQRYTAVEFVDLPPRPPLE
jgi:uncharacterized protein